MSEVLNKLNEWVTVLKSNSKNQGKFNLFKVLRGECFYCCLGVLGELLPKCTFDLNDEYAEHENLTSLKDKDYFSDSAYWVKEKYYLNTKANVFTNNVEYKAWAENYNIEYKGNANSEVEDILISFNDYFRLTFSQIAEFLELFFIPYVEEQENEKSN